MRFDNLDTAFISVDHEQNEVHVTYHVLGADKSITDDYEEEQSYFIRLTIKPNNVTTLLEDEHELIGSLTDEEELFVLQHYAMETVYEVARGY